MYLQGSRKRADMGLMHVSTVLPDNDATSAIDLDDIPSNLAKIHKI